MESQEESPSGVSVSFDDCDDEEAIMMNKGEKLRPKSTSVPDYVLYLVGEISEVMKIPKEKRDQKRQQLEFYNIVRGGNTDIVKQVLEHLSNNGLQNELDWVLGKSGKSPMKEKLAWFRWLLNAVCFGFCTLLFVVLTPIFYCTHAAVHSIYEMFRSRLSRSIQLPLVFAVLSEDAKMVKIFLDYGCDVSSKDKSGNNIYHYLADLSIDQPFKAVCCHELLYTSNDSTIIHNCLFNDKNCSGLTAIDLCSVYGSLHFFQKLISSRVSTGEHRLDVSKHKIHSTTKQASFDLHTQVIDDKEDDSSNQKPIMSILEFDNTRYEKGDIFGDQSLLLHSVTGRSVDHLSSLDADALNKSKIISKWMETKMKLYAMPFMFGQSYSLLISILLMYYVSLHDGQMNDYPLSVSLYDKLIEFQDFNYSTAFTKAIDHLKESCQSMTELEIRKKAYGYNLSASDMKQMKQYDETIETLFDSMLASVFVVDIILRMLFLWKQFNFHSKTIFSSIVPLMYRWIPGSYVEKQLSIFITVPFFLSMYVHNTVHSKAETVNGYLDSYLSKHYTDYDFNKTINVSDIDANNQEEFDNLKDMIRVMITWFDIYNVLFVTGFILRFFTSIHALRLLPGIGFFIITTKKMGRHLMQFGVVFTIIILIFAIMFNLGIHTADCKAEPDPEYQFLSSSIYLTFQLALGHGNFEKYSSSVVSKVAYVFCCIFIAIMLLNLIIAVMTTTATDLNTMPWRDLLYKVEVWDEFLGIEAQFLSLTQLYICVQNKIRTGRCCNKLCTFSWCQKCKFKRRNKIRVVYFVEDLDTQ